MVKSKAQMADEGKSLVRSFCHENGLVVPRLCGAPPSAANQWQATGLYEPEDNGTIYVNVSACAAIGVSGAAWSYPGHIIDRTPYGVHAHELGHHLDSLCSPFLYRPTLGWEGKLSRSVCKDSGEPPITTYAPNVAEWFAEMCRLFCTNPDLLRLIRPKTYKLLRKRFAPVVLRPWRRVLQDAPERTIKRCEKVISGG